MKGKFWITWVCKKTLLCLFSTSKWWIHWTSTEISSCSRMDTQSSLYCGFVEAGSDMRRRSSGREEDDEELQRRRQLQEEQLMKVIITLSSYCFWTPYKKCFFSFHKQFFVPQLALFYSCVFLIAIFSLTLVLDNWY